MRQVTSIKCDQDKEMPLFRMKLQDREQVMKNSSQLYTASLRLPNN